MRRALSAPAPSPPTIGSERQDMMPLPFLDEFAKGLRVEQRPPTHRRHLRCLGRDLRHTSAGDPARAAGRDPSRHVEGGGNDHRLRDRPQAGRGQAARDRDPSGRRHRGVDQQRLVPGPRHARRALLGAHDVGDRHRRDRKPPDQGRGRDPEGAAPARPAPARNPASHRPPAHDARALRGRRNHHAPGPRLLRGAAGHRRDDRSDARPCPRPFRNRRRDHEALGRGPRRPRPRNASDADSVTAMRRSHAGHAARTTKQDRQSHENEERDPLEALRIRLDEAAISDGRRRRSGPAERLPSATGRSCRSGPGLRTWPFRHCRYR